MKTLDLSRLNYIKEATTEELGLTKFLEDMICKLGFNDELLHEQPHVVINNTGGLYIWQYPNQFAKYLCLLQTFNISSYIEIGCRWGGTYMLTTEYLARFNQLYLSVAVDVISETPVKQYVDQNHYTVFKQLDSRSPQFREYIEEQLWFDLVFIDGDHSYEGVKSDYETMRDFSGIFVFHDITSDVCPGVRQFWNELKSTEREYYSFYEYTEQYPEVRERTGNSYLGIGVAVHRSVKRRKFS